MHQSFATPATQGPGNSGGIAFSVCKDRVYALHCRGGGVLIKSLQIVSVHSATSPPAFVGKSKAPHDHGTTGLLLLLL